MNRHTRAGEVLVCVLFAVVAATALLELVLGLRPR